MIGIEKSIQPIQAIINGRSGYFSNSLKHDLPTSKTFRLIIVQVVKQDLPMKKCFQTLPVSAVEQK